jgi:prepilin-type N-terminal cleavage/methylation domain-containing protein
MKKKVLKGFTLIELIVVMAIFMVVMAAAMALVQPVSKTMTLADVRETGAAQVNSITRYLQNELGSVEYIMPANYIPTDDGKAMVNKFVEEYYEGVLKAGASTTPGASDYGSGKVHVMTIDNVNGGKISEWIYDVTFKLNDGSSGYTYITGTPQYKEYAINKAYYQNTTYRIEIGDTTTNAMTNFLTGAQSNEYTFTITSFVTRGISNPQTYKFTSTATTPLVNIVERRKNSGSGSKCVKGKYYVVNETLDTTTPTPTMTRTIQDITDANISSKLADSTLTYSRQIGGLASVEPVLPQVDTDYTAHPTSGPNSQYTFVYSFGNEMKTS